MSSVTDAARENDWWHKLDDDKARQYDARAQKALAGYSLLHELTSALAGHVFGDNATLLLAGCGTGLELLKLSDINKTWVFTGVEPSLPMAEICQKRIEINGLEKRAELVCSGVETIDLAKRYDGATSLLVSHFIRNEKDKLAYFQSLSKRLKSGAKLLVADIVTPNSENHPFTDTVFAKSWADMQLQHGIAPDMVKKGISYAQNKIYPLNIDTYTRSLEQANFKVEECYFKALFFSGFMCSRA